MRKLINPKNMQFLAYSLFAVYYIVRLSLIEKEKELTDLQLDFYRKVAGPQSNQI